MTARNRKFLAAYLALAALIVLAVFATVYVSASLPVATAKAKPSFAFANRLAEGIRTEYNAREQAKGEPFRAVKLTCKPGLGQDLYSCRALTLSPAGVDCILLVVYAKGDKQFTVQAASTDPNCPEGETP